MEYGQWRSLEQSILSMMQMVECGMESNIGIKRIS